MSRWLVDKAMLRPIALILVVLVGAVGCGLSLDESPRTIDSQNLPPELVRGQLPAPTATPVDSDVVLGRDQVYMIQNNRLVTVERPIAETPEELLESLLLDTFPAEAAIGISSAIFRGARVQRVQVNDLLALAIVDLAPNSLDPRNTEQGLAFAQFVYTLTSLDGIDQVQFVSTDPDNPDAGPIDLAVLTDTGSTLAGDRVTRADFARLTETAVAEPTFDIPFATPTPTPDPDAEPVFPQAVWMLNGDDDLIRVRRTVERNPEALLVAVIEGPTLDERTNLSIRSALPPDALPNSVTVENFDVEVKDEFGFETLTTANIAIVDFSSSSLPNVSVNDADQERFLAVAQIVFTLTSLEEIDQVVLSVDGQPIPVPSDRGQTLPFDPNIPRGLRSEDYVSALPPVPTPTPDPAITATAEGGDTSEPQPTPVPTPTPGS